MKREHQDYLGPQVCVGDIDVDGWDGNIIHCGSSSLLKEIMGLTALGDAEHTKEWLEFCLVLSLMWRRRRDREETYQE